MAGGFSRRLWAEWIDANVVDPSIEAAISQLEDTLIIDLFNIADTAWSTEESTPTVLDWSFINLGKAIKQIAEETNLFTLDDIIDYVILAQIAVSDGTGYLIFRNYTDDVDIATLSTTASVKSNREAVRFTIDKSLLEQEKVFALYAYNDPGGTGYDTYVGKVQLIIRYRKR